MKFYNNFGNMTTANSYFNFINKDKLNLQLSTEKFPF